MYTMYTPEQFMGRTGYQIFVDRFCHVGPFPNSIEGRVLKDWEDTEPKWWPDEDGIYRNQYFYGGNLKGITSRLLYLESLGIDLIYLSPISYTKSSHHYDVEDQRIIDPWIGNKEDFAELCAKAHQRGILVCVDLVFNHMGSNSPFFQEALQDKNSKYRDWFEWNEQGYPICWYGFQDLPQCNKLNQGYQEYACEVCEFYLNLGADGIRLDLGEILPEVFLKRIKDKVKTINPEALIVNEMWELVTEKEKLHIFDGQVDAVMNYPMADAICRWIRYGNEKHFEYTYGEIEKYPKQVQNVLWNFLDTHDTPRAINMLKAEGMNENPFSGRIWDIEMPWRRDNSFDTLGFRHWEAERDSVFNKKIAQKRLKLASLLQYFAPGNPIVYYGTEVGLTGYKDPFNRKPYPWGKWDESKIQNLLHYQTLGVFRKYNKDILEKGETVELIVDPHTLLWVRETEVGALYLVINRTNLNQDNPLKDWNIKDLKKVYWIEDDSTETTLSPYSAIVYRRDN